MNTNRLIHENSPYLLQHARNPVDWYPWGNAAFDKAKKENKPVFLSVGYATCHWCHVMARESFEDTQVAEMLNTGFVSIKVDREERPEIDAVYMAACHLVTGSGGWPLTIIMTWDKKPFFAGTYLPKIGRLGRMGVLDLGRKVLDLWHQAPDIVVESAQELMTHLEQHFTFMVDPAGPADQDLLGQTAQQIEEHFDPQYGGFETAPKFPTPHRLIFLLNSYEQTKKPALLHMVQNTLVAMRLGGIWDHVGFGFHRYATDRQWLLPHFEKMLYDQAWLAIAYLKAYQLTGEALFKQTAGEIFTYVSEEMTDAGGGFYSARDADSEGEEGKFYVWPWAEFEGVAKTEYQGIPWEKIFNLQRSGNFLEEATRLPSGSNILHLTQELPQWAKALDITPAELDDQWQSLRSRLFEARSRRVPPAKDDKILTDWNGMMIAALATGARVLGDDVYLQAAENATDFVLKHLEDGQQRLLHRFRQNKAAIRGTANDYAFMIMGLLALAQVNQREKRLSQAVALQRTMNDLFWDPDPGGFFLTDRIQNELPVRPKEIYDGAIPSANSVTLNNLAILASFTGEQRWIDQSRALQRAFAGTVYAAPMAYTHTLNGWHRLHKLI